MCACMSVKQRELQGRQKRVERRHDMDGGRALIILRVTCHSEFLYLFLNKKEQNVRWNEKRKKKKRRQTKGNSINNKSDPFSCPLYWIHLTTHGVYPNEGERITNAT